MKVKDMQKEFLGLKKLNDFETILNMHSRWASVCFDFKNKYLNFDYLKNLVNAKLDKIMQPICVKIGKCFMCLEEDAKLSCNNMKDQSCITCKRCAGFCADHGYFCRFHASYEGSLLRD